MYVWLQIKLGIIPTFSWLTNAFRLNARTYDNNFVEFLLNLWLLCRKRFVIHSTCFILYKTGVSIHLLQDEYRRLRELFTSGTDVFLVCFSVADPETLENVKRNWLTEIRILSPKASYILVGTKTDMRENTEVISRLKEINKRPISSQDGVKFANANGAKSYVECSAMNKDGLKDVFEQCVMAATNQQPVKVKDKYKEKHNPQCAVS